MGACASQQENMDNTQNAQSQDNNGKYINNVDPNVDEKTNYESNSNTSDDFSGLIKTMNEHTKTIHNTHQTANDVDHANILNTLNDFHRLQQSDNGASFKIVANKLMKCDIAKCIIARRNYRDRTNLQNHMLYPNTDQYNDPDTVHCQILDKIHCYFQHTIGRSLKTDEGNENDEHLSRKLMKLKESSTNTRQNHSFNAIQNQRSVKYNQVDASYSFKVAKYIFGWQFDYSSVTKAECKHNRNIISIRRKYQDLKTELTCENNIAYITMKQFNVENEKAVLHYESEYRKIKFPDMETSHTLALMMYCNFDELSNKFSCTYYQDKGTKHENYYHLGKLLKEAVIEFGTRVSDGVGRHFYHGCSQHLTPEDIMGDFGKGVKIFIPLSTSSSLEVAINFTNNRNGIIMEFGGERSKAKYYSTCWLSDYANESEYLFLQNRDELQIINIIDAHKGHEYKKILNALRTMSCMMSMDYVQDDRIVQITNENSAVMKLIKKIIRNQLNLNSFDSLTEYGKRLTSVHFNNTETLSINYSVLEYTSKDLFKLFCLTEYEWVNADLLHSLFPNVKDIEIKGINLCSETMDRILNDSSRNDLWNLNKLMIKVNKDSDLSTQSAILQYEKSLAQNGLRIADWSENMLILDPIGNDIDYKHQFTNNGDDHNEIVKTEFSEFESEALNRLTNAIISYNNEANENHVSVADTLNDFLLITTHPNYTAMRDIMKHKLEKCDISTCNIFERNYRDRNQFTDKNNIHQLYQANIKQEQKYEDKYIADCQILDKIHCFVQHASDINNILSNKKNNKKNINKKIISTLQNRMSSKYNQLYYDNLENMYIFGCEINYIAELDEGEGKIDDNIMVVTQKYGDIKEELTNGNFLKQQHANLDISTFNTEEQKAERYYNSDYRKQHFHEISIQHVLAVLIYCHYDNLEFVFSKTYRERGGIDHCNFYHFGKLLQESVLKFGTSIKDGKKKRFYHGINEALLLPQIIGDLCKGVCIFCPLSTSTELNVALRFTNNNNGLLIEFGGWRSKARYFSCAWLSDFSEDECLFLQNKYPFQINNIIDCIAGKPCKQIINALKTLETVMSQDFVEPENSILAKRDNMIPLIKKIIKHQLSIQLPNENWKPFKSLEEYARKLILVYFRNKRKLSINYSVLDENYPKLFKLFCLDEYEWINMHRLYALFPNITDVDVKNINLCRSSVNNMFDHFSKQYDNDSWKINKMMVNANANSELKINNAVLQYGKQFEQIGLNITTVNWSNDILLVQQLQ